jgi:hypothetical protein
MLSIGMFTPAHVDVVSAPVSCENIVGRRVV